MVLIGWLLESEGRLRLLLNSTAEEIYGLDLNGTCTFCNPACLHLLGYRTPQDLIGKAMHPLVHPTRADGTPYPLEAWCMYQAFQRGEKRHVDDEVIWRANGTSVPVEYWSYPIRRGEKVVGAAVTFVDISESAF
jgi:PAS domain S-box-containing protein